MFFAINWIISIVVFFVVASLFNFRVSGWILGLIASYIYKEFIGPLFIVNTWDKIQNMSQSQPEGQSFSNLSQLKRNFNFEDTRNSNFCIHYYHKSNDALSSHNIKFKISLVQHKNELFRLTLRMAYDTDKKGDLTDVIFNGKTIQIYDTESYIGLFDPGDSFFNITPKKEHQKDLINDSGKLQIIFENCAETIPSDDLVYLSFIEGFNFGIHLNSM